MPGVAQSGRLMSGVEQIGRLTPGLTQNSPPRQLALGVPRAFVKMNVSRRAGN